jgi:hypothetical protein
MTLHIYHYLENPVCPSCESVIVENNHTDIWEPRLLQCQLGHRNWFMAGDNSSRLTLHRCENSDDVKCALCHSTDYIIGGSETPETPFETACNNPIHTEQVMQWNICESVPRPTTIGDLLRHQPTNDLMRQQTGLDMYGLSDQEIFTLTTLREQGYVVLVVPPSFYNEFASHERIKDILHNLVSERLRLMLLDERRRTGEA